MATQQFRAFTVKAQGGRLPVLKTTCKVAPPHVKAGEVPATDFKSFTAIWDTGATGTVITQAIVDALNLKPTGMVKVHGVGGEHLSETYLVNIVLPNSVQFGSVRVTRGDLPGGEGGDVLIGMDIITMGDFAVTNAGGVTCFSFRVPPRAHIDYVEESSRESAAAAAAAQAAKSNGGKQLSSRQLRRAQERAARKGR